MVPTHGAAAAAAAAASSPDSVSVISVRRNVGYRLLADIPENLNLQFNLQD